MIGIKKAWPSDAVMIVAAKAGEEIRELMETVEAGQCRNCRQSVNYDIRTIRAALNMPERLGRPMKFFCIPCAVEHGFESIDVLVDHRP